MPLFEVIPTTTPAVQNLVHELVSLLPQLSDTQVPTEDKDMGLFEYQQTEKCKELPRNLFKGLARENDIKHAVEIHAQVTVPKELGDKRPIPMLQRLDAGWVQVPSGYIALVTLLPEDCVKPVEIQVRANLKDGYSETNQHSVMLFELVYFRTEPAGIPYHDATGRKTKEF